MSDSAGTEFSGTDSRRNDPPDIPAPAAAAGPRDPATGGPADDAERLERLVHDLDVANDTAYPEPGS
jgi:hypothetical protein